jgi:hypothetical protein
MFEEKPADRDAQWLLVLDNRIKVTDVEGISLCREIWIAGERLKNQL